MLAPSPRPTPSPSEASGVDQVEDGNFPTKVLVGYFPNWFQWWPSPHRFLPEHIQADKITHLNHAFAMIHSKTFRIIHFEDNDIGENGLYKRVNNLKLSYPHLK